MTGINNSLVRKNLEATAMVDKNAGKINSYLTAENSFCYAGILMPTVGVIDEGVFYFYNIGEYPLKDINIKIIDIDHLKNSDSKNMFDAEKNYELQTLKPNKITFTQFPIKLDKEKQNNLKIYFSTNAGDFIQELKLKFAKNTWLTAEKVINPKTHEILLVRVDPIFGDPTHLFER